MSWSLLRVDAADIDELMTWFPDAGSVDRSNIPAYRCYRSVGFEVQDYPEGAPLPDLCYYLTRPIN